MKRIVEMKEIKKTTLYRAVLNQKETEKIRAKTNETNKQSKQASCVLHLHSHKPHTLRTFFK